MTPTVYDALVAAIRIDRVKLAVRERAIEAVDSLRDAENDATRAHPPEIDDLVPILRP